MKIDLKEEYIEELKRIFNNYCPRAQIWAYGSRVKNQAHSGSDLDLVVKSFNEENKQIGKLNEIIQNSNIPFLVDLKLWDHLPLSFQKEILKNYFQFFG